MRCKVGDLAICVAVPPTSPQDLGVIVKIVSRSDIWEDAWVVEPPYDIDQKDGLFTHWPDSYLKPLRDNDGEDETLTWAPWKVKA